MRLQHYALILSSIEKITSFLKLRKGYYTGEERHIVDTP